MTNNSNTILINKHNKYVFSEVLFNICKSVYAKLCFFLFIIYLSNFPVLNTVM